MTVPVCEVNALGALCIGALSYLLGGAIKARVEILRRLSFPVPFIGGLPVAVLFCLLRLFGLVNITFAPEVAGTALKFFLCALAFFGSWPLIRGSIFFALLFWIFATLLSALQNAAGILLAKALGLDPLYGFLAGAVSLMGGMETYHQFSAAFSSLDSLAVDHVVRGAETFGILSALCFGAPFGEWLIKRYKLRNEEGLTGHNRLLARYLTEHPTPFYQALSRELIRVFALVVLAVICGDAAGALVGSCLPLPSYVYGMTVAILIRLAADRLKLLAIENLALQSLTKATLTMFIAVNVCSLHLETLWELPLTFYPILLGQLLLNILFAWLVYFRFLGRDYQSMMLAVGGIGFSMGITANGLSNMQSLCEKYGPAMRVIFIVVIVGMILVGITNSFVVGAMLGCL
jgi:ESS family glutamate:Na+ symporter